MTSFVEKIVAIDAHLTAAEVGHAFGGAICLGYHVESPRATVDIDLNIAAELRRACRVLKRFPAGVIWDANDVAQIRRDGQARVFWDRTPVDLFFPQHQLHASLLARVESVPFASATIPILSATDLTIFKALFNRGKDWVDIGEMVEYGNVDLPEARRWLVRLVGRSDQRVRRLDSLQT